MTEQQVAVETSDGAAPARWFLPEGHVPRAVVVFYMDAFGLRPAMSQMAARLVAAGYAVLQPDLYWRSGPFDPFDVRTAFSDPPERARIGALMRALRPEQVVDDTVRHLDALAARVDTGRVGLVGYCMGGRVAHVVAGHLGARVAAAAAIHAGGLVTGAPDSPHLLAPRIRARMYYGVADHDNGCTAADCAVLAEHLTRAGVAHHIERYPGARHGFAVPDFPIYDEAAAERHWERVLALFRDTLPA